MAPSGLRETRSVTVPPMSTPMRTPVQWDLLAGPRCAAWHSHTAPRGPQLWVFWCPSRPETVQVFRTPQVDSSDSGQTAGLDGETRARSHDPGDASDQWRQRPDQLAHRADSHRARRSLALDVQLR